MSPTLIATLAELPAPDSATSIGFLALAFFAIIGGVNQALRFFDRLKEKPIPSDTYATKTEHGELKIRVDRVETRTEENFRALDHKRSVSIAGLHDDLRDKTEALRKEIKADTEHLNTRITEVLSHVAEIRGRISKP